MESTESQILPRALTDVELARYIYSLIADPDVPSIPKSVVNELVIRFGRTLSFGQGWQD